MPQLASVSKNGLRGWLPSLPTPKTKACPSLYYEDDVHQEVKQELCNEISKEETSPSK